MKLDSRSEKFVMAVPECFANGRYVAPNKIEKHYGDIIASEAEYPKGLSSVWHYHENPHFSHILNGGSIELREYNSQYQVSGTSMYYSPCLVHKNIEYRADTRIFNLELQKSFFTKHDLYFSESANYWSPFDEHLKKNLIVRLFREYCIDDSNSQLSVEQLCLLLCDQNLTIPKFKGINHWSFILREYLYENWNIPLNLELLSSHVGIHPVNISRYFAKYFNCTLGEYMRMIKIEKSLPQVRNKKYSLTEIAYNCGFTDQSHFTKTFKQITGILPKTYRRF